VSTILQKNVQFPGNEPEAATALGEPSGCQSSNLQFKVGLLTNSISDERIRLTVAKVMADLVFLLDSLGLVAGSRNVSEIKEVESILETVRCEAFSLAAFIEDYALQLEGLDDGLRETLDCSAYAINHEVRRIFLNDLVNVSFDQDDQDTRGALLHAQGVLTNCFQHCMINLARVFDASLTDASLFEDWQRRRESSLVLYRDLTELIVLIQSSFKDSLNSFPNQAHGHLEAQLAAFRDGSMQFLMYRDWQQFESLSEAIVATIRSGESPADRLHHMGCYLQTLLAHVKARSVLTELAL
jgi:hypothetical protein